ncbi:MAG TPA: methyltransferase [Leifsonia sp.]|nr:methyltransferase [Leifsonia sp.]
MSSPSATPLHPADASDAADAADASRAPSASEVAALRSDLEAAGFTVAALSELWGSVAAAALHRGQRVPAVRALATQREKSGETPLATLAEFFVLGRAVRVEALSRALPTLGVECAIRLGLARAELAKRAELAEPNVDLRPYSFVDARGAAEWWIASDLGELALGHALPIDHVLGVGGASVTLSGLMLQAPVERALDLGTGCGIQAMHASRHARHVVATDISTRALELAELNIALNRIENVECRLGSLFEPVAGEAFDHIVTNPPFVITPRSDGVPEYEYRDGGMVGDGLVESVIRSAGEHLTPGGVAQLLANWEYQSGADAFDRVAGWIDTSIVPVDSWVIEREKQDAAEYAETWIRDGGTLPGTADFDTLLDAWLTDFAERGVDAVGFGYVLLRRPAEGAPTLRRHERMHGTLGANEAGLGVHLGSALQAHDWQAALDDPGFAATRFAAAADLTEERHFWPGDESPTAMLLRQGGGFGRAIQGDTALIAFVGACDGELPAGVIIGAIAQLLEVDEAALAAELLPVIRALVVDGMLVPVE